MAAKQGTTSLRLEKVGNSFQVSFDINHNEIIDIAKTLISKQLEEQQPIIDDVDKVKDFLTLQLANEEREVFAALFLDGQYKPLAFEKLFFGTINKSAVYPREIIKRAFHHNAASIIFAHNHPSGQAKHSPKDIELCQLLIDTLQPLGLNFIDHVVVGNDQMESFLQILENQ